MTQRATGTFDVVMRAGPGECDDQINRFELSKTFHGDLHGTGSGVMLSSGDPHAGEAGYVAIEVVRGELAGREGSFAMMQLGSMHAGASALDYEVVPGSGGGDLAGIVGTLHLDIDDGIHHYELRYDL